MNPCSLASMLFIYAIPVYTGLSFQNINHRLPATSNSQAVIPLPWKGRELDCSFSGHQMKTKRFKHCCTNCGWNQLEVKECGSKQAATSQRQRDNKQKIKQKKFHFDELENRRNNWKSNWSVPSSSNVFHVQSHLTLKVTLTVTFFPK